MSILSIFQVSIWYLYAFAEDNCVNRTFSSRQACPESVRCFFDPQNSLDLYSLLRAFTIMELENEWFQTAISSIPME